MKPTPRQRQQMLEDWRGLCAWLEERPYNASYKPEVYTYLLSSPPKQASLHLPVTNKFRRMIVAERRRLGVVYWAVGYGWRLRKDYRERLDAEEKEVAALTATTITIPADSAATTTPDAPLP